MKCRIEVDMDNAAFGYPEAELSRILKKLSEDLTAHVDFHLMAKTGDTVYLMDYNGNRVGKLEVDDN